MTIGQFNGVIVGRETCPHPQLLLSNSYNALPNLCGVGSFLGAYSHTVPLGAGFYAWDWGCKHGDIMVIGALSYAAPLLSVIALLAFGYGAFHWSVALACGLIVVGALVAAKDMIVRRT